MSNIRALTHMRHCWTCFCQLGSLHPIKGRTSKSTFVAQTGIEPVFFGYEPNVLSLQTTVRYKRLVCSYQTNRGKGSQPILNSKCPAYHAKRDAQHGRDRTCNLKLDLSLFSVHSEIQLQLLVKMPSCRAPLIRRRAILTGFEPVISSVTGWRIKPTMLQDHKTRRTYNVLCQLS